MRGGHWDGGEGDAIGVKENMRMQHVEAREGRADKMNEIKTDCLV